MQQTNGPHVLRVAGSCIKDTYARLKAWYKAPMQEGKDAWLRAHYPWVFPLVEQVIAEALAEHRARQGKESGHE